MRHPHPIVIALFVATSLVFSSVGTAQPPNIVWIIPDDMSAHFGCYGETAIETPNVDALAASGVQFNNAYVTAPVCSTCRSAFITGMYQTSIGAHHHRSGRGTVKIELPDDVAMVPKLFQDAGYHTSISGWPINGKLGKTDYNFEWDKSIYDSADWSDRKPGQPFFAQIQTQGGKLRGKDAKGWNNVATKARKRFGSATSIESVTLPPYYPNHPDIVRDWAAYLDSVRLTDAMVGEVIAKLEEQGVRENTLVLFMTDHGISHGRGKQYLYDEGLHVPLILSGPGIEPGTIRDDLVEHIDIAALSLAAAGIPIPETMQAKDVLSDDYQPREAAFAARDRCDETVDHIRSVRTHQFKYIRNFLPNRPYLQPCAYKDAKSILIALRQWHDEGKLDANQELIFRQTRPAEELFDLESDPHELQNLANDPAHAAELQSLRNRLDHWMETTGDQGRQPESAEQFESDIEVYLNTLRKRATPEHLQTVESNIELMKRWASEGK
ncbi:sulfatase family protein [Rhodopirellula halodulae]|uniref:sulfatase family protein n=1 Tax=Rhodopirellula halodulae TaxID=2894198 RepID=UPI001E50A6B3|nr:sulfatase [Rhodopirellula sp. JC737]MCC9658926.1 sulfatase [Rhodopirellula sp. JC737]